MKTEYINNGKWRTARKQYKCRECKVPIEVGSTYWEDYNECPNYFSGTRYCANCATGLEEVTDNGMYELGFKLIALAAPKGGDNNERTMGT